MQHVATSSYQHVGVVVIPKVNAQTHEGSAEMELLLSDACQRCLLGSARHSGAEQQQQKQQQ